MTLNLVGLTRTYRPGLYASTTAPGPVIRHSFTEITSVTVNPLLGTCRRRKPGVGK
jgi:hypothetical protein